MTRINTNVSSMLAQRVLGQQNKGLSNSLERLSTGLAINRGADNPAGLIASENLRSEKASIGAAIGNAERADQVVNIAEGGLQEISSLLLEVQSLVGQSANEAGLSQEEKEANQLQVDSILQTIDRIASSTSFQGTKLLNGTFDFNISGQSTSVDDFKINAAKLSHDETRNVQVAVTASAQHGSLFVSAGGGTSLDLANASSTFAFELAGANGSREFTFSSGATLAQIASTVNTFKEVTGVSAIASGNYLELKSTELGGDQFVSFELVDSGGTAGAVYGVSSTGEDTIGSSLGAFSALTNAIKDEGRDVQATVNGVAATSDGGSLAINTDFLDVEIDLSESGAQTLGNITALTITGGGAKFNLGPGVNITNQVSIGIENVAVRNLGNESDGYLDDLGAGKSSNLVDGNLETGQKIIDSAIKQVSNLRGRIGAFQKNTIGATIRSLGVALENTSAAESSVRDTDFASETAALTRNQILAQAATNSLSLANNAPQSALSLLG